jgi:hypothetical protein
MTEVMTSPPDAQHCVLRAKKNILSPNSLVSGTVERKMDHESAVNSTAPRKAGFEIILKLREGNATSALSYQISQSRPRHALKIARSPGVTARGPCP